MPKKKLIMVVVPVVAIGTLLGLALTGVVSVPGLSPKKKSGAALYAQGAAAYAEKKEEVPVAKAPEEPKQAPKPHAEVPASDAEAGAKKLAQYWNNVPTPKLVELSKGFSETDLALVLVKMDPEKVAEFLSALDSRRSAKLSKELQRVASLVPKPSA
ncbi:MAG: hypothetical protein JSS66_08315 [Armatimonadetes bacterium]|nr:hypothetical protein [Armatimonadota bacterium]